MSNDNCKPLHKDKMVKIYSYRVKAWVPDPNCNGSTFTFDNIVDTDQLLFQGKNVDGLINALAAKVKADKGVTVFSPDFVIKSIELEDSHKMNFEEWTNS